MFSHNGKISTRQVLILLILQMFNLNMLIMPRICTHYLERNGYIAPIFSIILGCIYLWCITALTTSLPNKTFVEITQSLLPNWIAGLLIIAFIVKLIVSVSLELRMFGEIVSQIILPKTPIAVIMIIMLLATAYLVKSGIEATGRMGEILIYFIAVPLIIVLLNIAFKADYEQILPFFQTDFSNVCKASINVSFMFIPIESLLMLTGLMKKPEGVRKVGSIAVITIGILQAIITLLCIVQIGVGETKGQIWPVIVLMKSMGMNNSILENQEVLMLIVWIFSAFMYISVGLYLASLMGSRSLKFKRENVCVLPLLPIILLIAAYPQDLGTVYAYYLKFEYYLGLWFVVPIPLILLLIFKLRGCRDEN